MNLSTHRAGVLSLAAVSIFLLCGDTAPQTCNTRNERIGPSGGQIAAATAILGGVVVGTVVLVHVHKEHHRLKGCVISGPNGLELKTADGKKTWALDGNVSKVKPGDMVQLHGDRVKRTGDANSEETFKVEKLKKQLGACPATP